MNILNGCKKEQADLNLRCAHMFGDTFYDVAVNIEKKMGRNTAFPTILYMRPAKTQISVRVRIDL